MRAKEKEELIEFLEEIKTDVDLGWNLSAETKINDYLEQLED